MRKIKKLIFNLTLFLFYANATNAMYMETSIDENNYLKRFLIFIGIILIVLVIDLGYKMDKKEEIKKRKEKYRKDNYDIKYIKRYEEKEDLEKIEHENKLTMTDETIKINYSKLKIIKRDSEELDEDKVYNIKKEDKLKNDSTMRINVVSEGNEKNIETKKLEVNEDFELQEIEEIIKEGNVRMYKRKKQNKVKKC